jgi:hypothetical protein
MKNSDGTSYEGTPEQFVQQQSSWFKKAFPKGFMIVYRGAHLHITDFKNRDRNDFAVFFTDNVENASTFTKIKKFYNPNLISSNERSGGLYQIAISKTFPRVIGEGEGRSWRLLNWDDKIAKGTKSEDYAKMHNDELKNFAISEYDLKGQYDQNKIYLSTDIYANYIKNLKNIEGIFEIRNVLDTMGDKNNKPNKPSTIYGIDANRIPIKSLRHNNGMFDMTNPDIYK